MNAPKAKTLKAKVTAFLKASPGKRFRAREIARGIAELYPGDLAAKRAGFATEALFLNQIVAEIGSQHKDIVKSGEVATTEGIRPRLYYHPAAGAESGFADGPEMPSVPDAAGEAAQPLLEKALYPLLAVYLRNEHNLYSKRIEESRSSNRRGKMGNKWLYPDIVAMEPLGREWEADIIDCVSSAGDNRVKLWSFEVKRQLNGSNIRESFFQAVSNSSWANYGYLVAADIVGGVTRGELDLLASLHGIGLIQLDIDAPNESQVLIPARERPAVDWQSADRVAKENGDFQTFIRNVKNYYLTNDIRNSDWEKVV